MTNTATSLRVASELAQYHLVSQPAVMFRSRSFCTYLKLGSQDGTSSKYADCEYEKLSPNAARMMNAAASDRLSPELGQKLNGLDAQDGMMACSNTWYTNGARKSESARSVNPLSVNHGLLDAPTLTLTWQSGGAGGAVSLHEM